MKGGDLLDLPIFVDLKTVLRQIGDEIVLLVYHHRVQDDFFHLLSEDELSGIVLRSVRLASLPGWILNLGRRTLPGLVVGGFLRRNCRLLWC